MTATTISFCILPDNPADEIIEAIVAGDRLGFDRVYVADEIYHQDAWQLLALAARETERIKLFCTTHIVLKDPTYVAQQLMTLDALSNGRAGTLFSIGNLGMLEQFHVDIPGLRMIGRSREAYRVIRTFIDEGKIDLDGRFFKYDSVFTSARPVQKRIPLTMGGQRGPKTFELAGEVADGFMTGLAYSEEALRYALDHFDIGATRGGRDPKALDRGAGLIGTIAKDGEAARRAARVVGAFYIPATPDAVFERHGIDLDRVRPIKDAFASGNVADAIAMTPDDITDRLILPVGTADDWVEQLNGVTAVGYNHLCLTPIDAGMVERVTGESIAGVPTVVEQLRLIHDHVMPRLA